MRIASRSKPAIIPNPMVNLHQPYLGYATATQKWFKLLIGFLARTGLRHGITGLPPGEGFSLALPSIRSDLLLPSHQPVYQNSRGTTNRQMIVIACRGNGSQYRIAGFYHTWCQSPRGSKQNEIRLVASRG